MAPVTPRPDQSFPGLAFVIAGNARRLRVGAGLTLDQVSVAARLRGLKWSESRVADFEAGRVAANLGTLLAFCVALADLGCTEATLPRLVEYVPPIEINDSLQLSAAEVTRLMAGRPVGKLKHVDDPRRDVAVDPMDGTGRGIRMRPGTTEWAVNRNSGATETRITKTLGIPYARLIRLSTDLWGRSFSQERNSRAGEGANAQHRGQITRKMMAELREAVDGND